MPTPKFAETIAAQAADKLNREREIRARIESDFTAHQVSAQDVVSMDLTRKHCLALAELIVDLAPDCRSRCIALTRLEEVMFHANAAIARNSTKEKES